MKSHARVLSDRDLKSITGGASPLISVPGGVFDEKEQIQPSSLDLTLGNKVYGMGDASLPRKDETIARMVERCHYEFTLDDGQDGFLNRRYTYLVPLREKVLFPELFSAKFSPKSSTGRTDVFVRVIADGVSRFDHVPPNYKGNLALEVTSLSFPIKIRPKLSLVQMRIRSGDPRLTGAEVSIRHSKDGIFYDKHGRVLRVDELRYSEAGVYMHIDLDRDIVGFVARNDVQTPLVLSQKERCLAEDYWEPIMRPKDGSLVLTPDRFYLLATKERVRIPSDLCGDIAPYDATTGEFRTHYAGFFDPGFGLDTGITGVLEVRGREMPHRLFDGDPVCLMVFEHVSPVDNLYRGHYQSPGPSLSKHFKDRWRVWEK